MSSSNRTEFKSEGIWKSVFETIAQVDAEKEKLAALQSNSIMTEEELQKRAEKFAEVDARVSETINELYKNLRDKVSVWKPTKEELLTDGFYKNIYEVIKADNNRDFIFRQFMSQINKIEKSVRVSFYQKFMIYVANAKFMTSNDLYKSHQSSVWRAVHLILQDVDKEELNDVFTNDFVKALKSSDIVKMRDLSIGSEDIHAEGYSLYTTLLMKNADITEKLKKSLNFTIESDICLAIRKDDKKLVELLLKHNPKLVNHKVPISGTTLLMMAIEHDSIDAAKLLLSLHARGESKEEKSSSMDVMNNNRLLSKKVEQGSFDSAQLLLSVMLKDKCNPLDYALKYSNYRLAEFIVRCHFNLQSEQSENSFINALVHDAPQKLDMEKLNYKTIEEQLGVSPFVYAILNNKIVMLMKMLECKKFVEQITGEVLAAAVCAADVSILELFLKSKDKNVNTAVEKAVKSTMGSEGATLLMFAAECGNKIIFPIVYDKFSSYTFSGLVGKKDKNDCVLADYASDEAALFLKGKGKDKKSVHTKGSPDTFNSLIDKFNRCAHYKVLKSVKVHPIKLSDVKVSSGSSLFSSSSSSVSSSSSSSSNSTSTSTSTSTSSSVALVKHSF